jgi:CubicO group peptidase (beta-lactamase class C family)
MARWDAALREGKYLKPETAALVLKPSQTADGETNQYGFGLSLYPDGAGGLYGYGHEGSWGGFRTSYYRYLSADRATVILSNKGDFDPDGFWYKLNDAIEQHQPH